MNIIELYSILFMGLLGICPIVGTFFPATRATQFLVTGFGRFVRYPVVLKGGFWMSISRLEVALFLSFLACNIFVLLFGVSGLRSLQSRAAVVATINITPLFLGGKPNPILGRLGIPPNYDLVHHWVGRVAILEGLIHAAASIGRPTTSEVKISGYITAISFLTISLTSIWVFRQYSYRMFLGLHALIAFSSLGGLFWHVIVQPRAESRIPVFVGAVLWALRFIFWLWRIFRAVPGAIRTRRPEKGAVYIQVSCARPVTVFPGCYFFVFLPGRVFRYDLTSSFPMLVMWYASNSTSGSNKEVAFLLSNRGRIFDISRLNAGNTVLLDGPYGRDLGLWDYETVILAAKGIGIAGVLSSALSLLDRKNQDAQAKKTKQVGRQLNRDLTRKIAILWVLEDNTQEDWAASAFRVLQGLDPESSFLLVWCIYPSEQQGQPPFLLNNCWQCFYSQKNKEKKFLNSLVSQDTRAPGKSAVVGSGDADFIHIVRQTVIRYSSSDSPIYFMESEYRPSSHGRRPRASESGLQEHADVEKAEGRSVRRPVRRLMANKRVVGETMARGKTPLAGDGSEVEMI